MLVEEFLSKNVGESELMKFSIMVVVYYHIIVEDQTRVQPIGINGEIDGNVIEHLNHWKELLSLLVQPYLLSCSFEKVAGADQDVLMDAEIMLIGWITTDPDAYDG